MDEVVHVYHHGFNKAIQNYSQVSLIKCIEQEISHCFLVENQIMLLLCVLIHILQLFSESAESISVLKLNG